MDEREKNPVPPNLEPAFERMRANRDERPEAIRLVANIKGALPELRELAERCASRAEDGVYRFYHQSYKVFHLQELTTDIAARLRALAPDPGTPTHEWFEEIVAAGTGKEFKSEDNANWTAITRPIVEAYFHAKYFLDMVIEYGSAFDDVPPSTLPSGWAAVLYLYDLR